MVSLNALSTLLLSVGISALTGFQTADAQGIKIDGSSSVQPITDLAVATFNKRGGTRLDVKSADAGTGAGFRGFCLGNIQIANASRPITAKETELCTTNNIKPVEIAVAFDAVALISHPQNSWVSNITTDELKKIWAPGAANTVTNWKQVRAGYPDMALKLTAPDSKSGTFDFFNQAINGGPKASRVDYKALPDHADIIKQVASEKGSLGYVALGYAKENADKVMLLAVDFGQGPVKPSQENVVNENYLGLTRVLYVYVNETTMQKDKALREFVEYYVDNSSRFAVFAQYIPLTATKYAAAKERVGRLMAVKMDASKAARTH